MHSCILWYDAWKVKLCSHKRHPLLGSTTVNTWRCYWVIICCYTATEELRYAVFSVGSALRLYNEICLALSGVRIVSGSAGSGQGLRPWRAGQWGQGLWNMTTGVSAVLGASPGDRLSLCCSALRSAWISDGAMVTCSYWMWEPSKYDYQSKPCV
jgi:hypothetical protein